MSKCPRGQILSGSGQVTKNQAQKVEKNPAYCTEIAARIAPDTARIVADILGSITGSFRNMAARMKLKTACFLTGCRSLSKKESK